MTVRFVCGLTVDTGDFEPAAGTTSHSLDRAAAALTSATAGDIDIKAVVQSMKRSLFSFSSDLAQIFSSSPSEDFSIGRIDLYEPCFAYAQEQLEALRKELGEVADPSNASDSQKFLLQYCEMMEKELTRLRAKYQGLYTESRRIEKELSQILTELMALSEDLPSDELATQMTRLRQRCLDVQRAASAVAPTGSSLSDAMIIEERKREFERARSVVPLLESFASSQAVSLSIPAFVLNHRIEFRKSSERWRDDLVLIDTFSQIHPRMLERHLEYFRNFERGLLNLHANMGAKLLEACATVLKDLSPSAESSTSPISIRRDGLSRSMARLNLADLIK
jgi:hypothetical protein